MSLLPHTLGAQCQRIWKFENDSWALSTDSRNYKRDTWGTICEAGFVCGLWDTKGLRGGNLASLSSLNFSVSLMLPILPTPHTCPPTLPPQGFLRIRVLVDLWSGILFFPLLHGSLFLAFIIALSHLFIESSLCCSWPWNKEHVFRLLHIQLLWPLSGLDWLTVSYIFKI